MHIGDLCPQNAMLVSLVVLSPMEACPVLVVAVPRLCNVDFSIYGPAERLLGQEPECRPDALCAGGRDDGSEDTLVSLEGMPAHQAGRGIFLLGAG